MPKENNRHNVKSYIKSNLPESIPDKSFILAPARNAPMKSALNIWSDGYKNVFNAATNIFS